MQPNSIFLFLLSQVSAVGSAVYCCLQQASWSWLLGRVLHADESVGVHPYRQWCHQTTHGDTRKCPIHVDAESGWLLILKLFITQNLLNLACRDPGGHDPLKNAI